ncbi:MAG: ChaN family lipoprotein [Hydrogenophaga sp.]|nr:ChaN family lipoprotein [Hydrogenophaga sp.]
MNRSLVAALFAALALTACAHRPPAPTSLPALLEHALPTPLLLVGEQHDAPEHQQLQRQLVQALAERGQLAAVVMEMIEAGRDTRGVARDADEAAVRHALGWDDKHNWPWPTYGPVVMAAVRAGVPVFGGNLPRSRMREAMGDATLDTRVPAPVLEQQREAIRTSHCDLLPATQLAPMARIQLARDRAMAQEAMAQLAPGRTVLLIAGNGHVRSDLGVPLHLPPGQAHRVLVARAGAAGAALPAHVYWDTPALPERDHCAELRER